MRISSDAGLVAMLEAMRDVFGNGNGFQANLYAMVLDEGQEWTPAPLPDDFRFKTPGFCFDNSIEIAQERGLRYVEGYAISSLITGMPIHHAWNVTEDGVVIDTTWPEPGLEYYGVVVEIKKGHREAWLTPLGVMTG